MLDSDKLVENFPSFLRKHGGYISLTHMLMMFVGAGVLFSKLLEISHHPLPLFLLYFPLSYVFFQYLRYANWLKYRINTTKNIEFTQYFLKSNLALNSDGISMIHKGITKWQLKWRDIGKITFDGGGKNRKECLWLTMKNSSESIKIPTRWLKVDSGLIFQTLLAYQLSSSN